MKQVFVIKIGGNVIDDPEALNSFLEDFHRIDSPKVLVHGGGKIASRLGDQLGIKSNYVDGRRITDDATIDLVTMVYGGLVNKQVVAQLQSLGCNAIGITGADANLLPAIKRPVKTIDFGWVGDVEAGKIPVNRWQVLLDNDFIPVLAPLTHDGQGHMLNTNADTMAAVIAEALSVQYNVRLLYCFEKKGILEDVNNDASVITHLDRNSYATLRQEGKLFAGILPKLDNAFAAIDAGVKEVLIGHAEDLLQNTTTKTTGTLITA
ncbi:acetylglutamate kinase [Flavihumibacter petaseus]|uniref:Acetylglutamate kinase n=1 Tax=Flavihumibacter petaseus NBRC 106054 TaxID=1220578 RepID=A0A0E9MZJ0_9BACT|nr:acetylglutamate kinase [Flavihumibacter petaseus]GAO43167.1 acetylglutamate kinase [Flavihumibacter petaseus NBRC 106054]